MRNQNLLIKLITYLRTNLSAHFHYPIQPLFTSFRYDIHFYSFRFTVENFAMRFGIFFFAIFSC